jgi:DNA modification methylase
VRRVLRDDGTLWLNIGDSYNAKPGQRKDSDEAGEKQRSMRGSTAAPSRSWEGCKPKDLIGIPWMLAFALRADGWYLRQEIIWAKPNPMPESVTDRCTKSHEQIFLLAKSPTYYFDAEAMKEPSVTNDPRRPYTSKGAKDLDGRSEWKSGQARDKGDFSLRNKRSVWTVTTKPFKGAHFATYPEELVEPMVLAGCPPGGIVLDQFFGSGTTGAVAQRLGRQWIGCELNTAYKPLQDERLRQPSLLLEAA